MDSSQSQYTNIAFISYKREDEQWAKWLQKKLEHYKLPTEIRKQNPNLEFAKNPRHVFKDTTDLGGGVLAKAIKEGLDSSKFLIVICSPRAAKSEWVCKEVQDFIDSGREEFIIPFIIDGEPYAKDLKNECFPEALKTLAGERELLGININENGRDSAAVKVVAQLFGLQFDTLWDRFQREAKRKRRYITGAFVAAIIFLLAIIAAGTWAYRQIDEKNRQISEQIIKTEQERDKATEFSRQLSAANDSISLQKNILQKTNEDLVKTKQNLTERNTQLREERDNLIKANVTIRQESALNICSKAHIDIENGELLAASRILINELNDTNVVSSEYVKARLSYELRNAYTKMQEGTVPIAILGHPFGEGSDIFSILFFNNGDNLIFTQYNQIYLYDTKNGKLLHSKTWKDDIYNLRCFDHDKKIIITGGSGEASVFDTRDLSLLYSLEAGTEVIESVDCSDNSKLIVACSGKIMKIWDYNGRLKQEKAFANKIRELEISNNGNYISVANGNDVDVYDIYTENVESFISHEKYVYSGTFSSDDKYIVTCSDDSTVVVWDIDAKRRLNTYKCNSYVSIAFFDNTNAYVFFKEGYSTGSSDIWSDRPFDMSLS